MIAAIPEALSSAPGWSASAASPSALAGDDPQRDLVDPALLGTRNVLEEVDRTRSVERVVVTSSAVAIFGDNVDVESSESGSFTEADWNETSSLDHQPYSFSKTVAERAAWAIADAQGRWRLTTVNPHFVMGPGTSPIGSSESCKVLAQLGNGSLKRGVPDLQLAMVDVRDVAEMHLLAAFHPNAAWALPDLRSVDRALRRRRDPATALR